MAPKKKGPKNPMSAQHKEALAQGRDQGRAVRKYLEAIEMHKPRPGRKRTPDSIKKRLGDIGTKMGSADALSRVLLYQERLDLQKELAGFDQKIDLTALEDGFVKAAKEYGSRKGISYAAWRAAGIDPATLKKAGISRAG